MVRGLRKPTRENCKTDKKKRGGKRGIWSCPKREAAFNHFDILRRRKCEIKGKNLWAGEPFEGEQENSNSTPFCLTQRRNPKHLASGGKFRGGITREKPMLRQKKDRRNPPSQSCVLKRVHRSIGKRGKTEAVQVSIEKVLDEQNRKG